MKDPKEEGASGTVDDRDKLKPNQWDRSGAGEIQSDEDTSAGHRSKTTPEHTSAGK